MDILLQYIYYYSSNSDLNIFMNKKDLKIILNMNFYG